MSAPTRARKRTLMRALIYIFENFLRMIELDKLWFKTFLRRKGFGANNFCEDQMKALYLLFTAPPILTLSTPFGRYAGFLCQIARVGYVFTKQNALIVSISFASVMLVANGDPVKVTIEGARFRRFKANARTRSWHGTMKSEDMYGNLCARGKGCAPLSLYSTPAVLHLRG